MNLGLPISRILILFLLICRKCGNQQCFLFNIAKNIRFDAVKGKGFYQFCPNPNCIKFGETDLVFDVFLFYDYNENIGGFQKMFK